jgi:hypothetical protein
MRRGSRPVLVLALVLVAAALLGALALWRRLAGPARPRSEPVASAPQRSAAGEAAAPSGAARPEPSAPAPAPEPPVPAPDAPAPGASDPLAALADAEGAWSSVDLDAVREALPNNLYWELGAPTQDQRVVDERERERERQNAAWGKVLSNTATEEEIRAYYARRQRVSADYVEFASYLLQHYGETLPERDVGLLELAIELHLARLEEYPRQIEEAIQRHEAHEAARQAWLEEQAAFEDEPPLPAE